MKITVVARTAKREAMLQDPIRLLKCAKWFHAHAPECAALPLAFDSAEDGVERLHRALLHEAHQAMVAETEPPQRAMMQAVDLGTREPGIITAARVPGGFEIARGDGRASPVRYERVPVAAAAATDIPPGIPKLPPRRAKAALEACERRAAKATERAERKAGPRKPRAPRAKKSAAAAGEKEEGAEEGAAENGAAEEGAAEEGAEKEGAEKEGAEKEGAEEEGAEATAARAPHSRRPPREFDAVVAPSDCLRRAPRRKGAQTYFASPVPHDRHLLALGACDPSDALRDTLLKGEPQDNPHLRLIEGPPGTGKTTRLVEEVRAHLAAHPEHRCLVCAPTNVGACNAFRRALALGVAGALCGAKAHAPPDTPRALLQEPERARVVFSTVTGRSGSRLWGQRFEAVLVDEAALCCEAHVWGLLRREVEHLVLVGDTAQLAPLVSAEGGRLGHGRSTMARLREAGVAFELLRTQRRMHPEIERLPSRLFYGGALESAYVARGPVDGTAPYAVLDVRGAEGAAGTSFHNRAEAEACVAEARRARDDGLRVVILVPYLAQVRTVHALASGVEVSTIDAFQGKEADAVVVGVVRTRAPGFWCEPSRLNVALTRAKHRLRVILDCTAWRGADPSASPLPELVADAARREVLHSASP